MNFTYNSFRSHDETPSHYQIFTSEGEPMNSIYKQLARKLDQIPNGFPETKSGVELKILARLFTPEEAELACQLSLEPQPAKAIAEQLGRDERETHGVLKGMVRKGLIEFEKGQRVLCFKLMPFIVGFYELQNAQIDEEFARLFEAYYHEALFQMMTMKPSVQRVIPIEKTIPFNIEVMPYERVSTYIEEAKSWGVLNCICRVQKKLIGQGCSHSLENCLAISSRPNAFKNTDAIRPITREEALEILVQADKEGLVHSTNNIQKGVAYICNCCTCSCGVLRGIVQYGNLNSVASSDFYAVVDKNLCTGCGTCVDRCQFNALRIEADACRVDRSCCFGCGLCVSTCPAQAIQLRQKPAPEIEPPPETEEEWRLLRTQARTAQPKSSSAISS